MESRRQLKKRIYILWSFLQYFIVKWNTITVVEKKMQDLNNISCHVWYASVYRMIHSKYWNILFQKANKYMFISCYILWIFFSLSPFSRNWPVIVVLSASVIRRQIKVIGFLIMIPAIFVLIWNLDNKYSIF